LIAVATYTFYLLGKNEVCYNTRNTRLFVLEQLVYVLLLLNSDNNNHPPDRNVDAEKNQPLRKTSSGSISSTGSTSSANAPFTFGATSTGLQTSTVSITCKPFLFFDIFIYYYYFN
jgi:hypothetical protein